MSTTELTPRDAHALLEADRALLVDVREAQEHRAERIPGSFPLALSAFDPGEVHERARGRRVVFHCRSGVRSRDAMQRYAQAGHEASHVEGGIQAWRRAGLETVRAPGAPRLDLMRQVQISAGSLVLAGAALGFFVHQGFFGLSAFVGAGLVFAGLSGTCGMASLLSIMPWNRAPACAPEGETA